MEKWDENEKISTVVSISLIAWSTNEILTIGLLRRKILHIPTNWPSAVCNPNKEFNTNPLGYAFQNRQLNLEFKYYSGIIKESESDQQNPKNSYSSYG